MLRSKTKRKQSIPLLGPVASRNGIEGSEYLAC